MAKRKVVRYVNKERLDNVNPENFKQYNMYLKSMKVKGTSEASLKVYKGNMNIFLCWLAENYGSDFYILGDEVKSSDFLFIMEDFILFCADKDEGLGNGMKNINTKLSSVSSFYHYCVKRGKLDAHPFAGKLDRMEGANDEKLISEYFLTKEETDKITEELSKVFKNNYKGIYDIIDAMIWMVSFDSSCRIGGLKNTKITNLKFNDDDSGYFDNVREKGGKNVQIPFTSETGKYIKLYLQWRKDNKISDDVEGFIISKYSNERGWQNMSTTNISNRVRRIGQILGLDDLRPHIIRKSRLNQIADKDIMIAQLLANHEDVSTTQKFYTKKKDANDAMQMLKKLNL